MPSSGKYALPVLQGVERQLELDLYSDVVIRLDSEDFHCHRFLLSSCSDFFRAMFRSGLRESHNGQVELKGITAETFRLILKCVYTGEDILTRDNMIDVWHASNQLQIAFLQRSCEDFAEENLSTDNCIDIYTHAKLLNGAELSEKAWRLLIKEFQTVSQTDGVSTLDLEDMERLVTDDELQVKSEDTVIWTIMRWVEEYRKDTHASPDCVRPDRGSCCSTSTEVDDQEQPTALESDCDERAWLSRLLAASRICLISNDCLMELCSNPLITGNQEAFEIVKTALRFKLQPETRGACPRLSAVYRKNSKLRNVLATVTRCGRLFPCLLYSQDAKGTPQKITWNNYEDDSDDDDDFSGGRNAFDDYLKFQAVVFNNDVFASTTTDTIEVYKCNPVTKSRTRLEDCDLARIAHAIAVYKGFLHIVSDHSITRLYLNGGIESPDHGEWEEVGYLPQVLLNATAAVFNHKIIIAGNAIVVDGGEPTPVIQCFDPETLTTSLPQVNITPEKCWGSQHKLFVTIGAQIFLLQDDGCLWHLEGNGHCLSVDLCGDLWDVQLALKSAIIYKDELVVLADPPMPSDEESGGKSNENVTSFETFESPVQHLFKRILLLRKEGDCLVSWVNSQ